MECLVQELEERMSVDGGCGCTVTKMCRLEFFGEVSREACFFSSLYLSSTIS